MSAVFAMGSSADSRWLPIVIGELQNPASDMRAEAARAAGSIGGSDAVDELANLLGDEDPAVTLAVIEALGQIGGERPAEILQELLGDSDFEDLHELIEEVMEEMDWLGGVAGFDWLDVDADVD